MRPTEGMGRDALIARIVNLESTIAILEKSLHDKVEQYTIVTLKLNEYERNAYKDGRPGSLCRWDVYGDKSYVVDVEILGLSVAYRTEECTDYGYVCRNLDDLYPLSSDVSSR